MEACSSTSTQRFATTQGAKTISTVQESGLNNGRLKRMSTNKRVAWSTQAADARPHARDRIWNGSCKGTPTRKRMDLTMQAAEAPPHTRAVFSLFSAAFTSISSLWITFRLAALVLWLDACLSLVYLENWLPDLHSLIFNRCILQSLTNHCWSLIFLAYL